MGSRNSVVDRALPAPSAALEGCGHAAVSVGKNGGANGVCVTPVAEEKEKGEGVGGKEGSEDTKEIVEGGVALDCGESMAKSDDVSRLGKSVPKSENTLDLADGDAASKAKRQKIGDGVTLPPSMEHHHHPECPLSTPGAAMAMPALVGKIGKGSLEGSTLQQYATDSATAMKNIQQWTAGNASVLNQFNTSTKDGISIAPGQRQLSTSHEQQATTTSDDLINDIIKGHVTAEDIVHRVSGSENVARCNRPPVSIRGSSGRVQEGVVKAVADSQIESVQKVFSSGNFSKHVPLTTSSTKNASSADSTLDPHTTTNPRAKTRAALECNSIPPSSGAAPARGPNTTTYAAPTSSSSPQTSDEQAVANMNLRRLIPHLEVLADLLQNPSSLETQYLAALSERAQMFPGSFPPPGSDEPGAVLPDSNHGPPLPNNLESLAAIAAHFGHLELGPDTAKDLPNAFEALATIASQNLTEDKSNLDITSLLSNADFAKLLPTLAALEMQGGLGYDQHDPNLKPVPITDPGAMKRLWDDMLLVESNPVYAGEPGVGGDGGGVAMEGLVDDMAEYVEERLQGQH
jgi:hypothetical protein